MVFLCLKDTLDSINGAALFSAGKVCLNVLEPVAGNVHAYLRSLKSTLNYQFQGNPIFPWLFNFVIDDGDHVDEAG